jgi:hypothetical protein
MLHVLMMKVKKIFLSFGKSILHTRATIVRKYCIIPSSSVPSESAFSVANFIQRKERNSLSSKCIKYSMVLRDRIV